MNLYKYCYVIIFLFFFLFQTHVPAVNKQSLDRIMKRVFYPDLEITKQLNEYRVEYQVLQEEMISVKPQIENLEKFKLMNKQLTQEVAQLNEQLEVILKAIFIKIIKSFK